MMNWTEYYLISGLIVMFVALAEALYGDWEGVREQLPLATVVCAGIVVLWPVLLFFLAAKAVESLRGR